MKKISFVLISLLSVGFAGSALAAKDAKTIRHCGCAYVSLDEVNEVSMVFHDVVVSGKSQGHGNHLAGSEDLCFAGIVDEIAVYETWVREADDCMVDGTNDGLSVCVAQEEFDPCGSEVSGN